MQCIGINKQGHNRPRVSRELGGEFKGHGTDMVQKLEKSKGITISGIIGDGDITTTGRLETNVNADIKKLSDRNHLKKLFTNSLYTLKKEHSSLTLSIMKHIQKWFS